MKVFTYGICSLTYLNDKCTFGCNAKIVISFRGKQINRDETKKQKNTNFMSDGISAEASYVGGLPPALREGIQGLWP